MTCEDCVASLGPYVDGELPAAEAVLVEEHLKTCPDCAVAHRRLMDTSSQLRAALMRYEAPDVLKARIRAGLVESGPDVGPRRVSLPSRTRNGWARGVAAAAAVAIVSSGLTFAAMQQRGTGSPVQQEVLASHIRSLMPGHLTDVESNDQHNVKPWFNGRVDVSPDVPRLDSLGYPLVGGRVDYIDGRNVASVVYRRRQHVINVFSWPSSDDGDLAPKASSSHGYNLIHARHGGEEVWLVSDLNVGELKEFERMAFPR
jgi:anti-sigma factor RsiW